MFPMQVSHKLKGCHVKSFSTLCCHCKSNTKCKDARIFPLCVNSDFLPLHLQRFSLFCVFSLTSPIPCMECAVNIESPKFSNVFETHKIYEAFFLNNCETMQCRLSLNPVQIKFSSCAISVQIDKYKYKYEYKYTNQQNNVAPFLSSTIQV